MTATSHSLSSRLSLLAAAAAGLGALAAPSVARANHAIDKLVDQFPFTLIPGSSTPWPGLWAGTINGVSQPTVSLLQSGLVGVVGGQRFSKFAAPAPLNFVTALIDGASTLDISAGQGASGVLELTYGSVTPLSLNLSADHNFQITLDGDESAARPLKLQIAVRSGSGSIVAHTFTLDHDATYNLPFSAFPGINFANVSFISFTFDGSAELALDYGILHGLNTVP